MGAGLAVLLQILVEGDPEQPRHEVLAANLLAVLQALVAAGHWVEDEDDAVVGVLAVGFETAASVAVAPEQAATAVEASNGLQAESAGVIAAAQLAAGKPAAA